MNASRTKSVGKKGSSRDRRDPQPTQEEAAVWMRTSWKGNLDDAWRNFFYLKPALGFNVIDPFADCLRPTIEETGADPQPKGQIPKHTYH